jgi:hypothetical protein
MRKIMALVLMVGGLALTACERTNPLEPTPSYEVAKGQCGAATCK